MNHKFFFPKKNGNLSYPVHYAMEFHPRNSHLQVSVDLGHGSFETILYCELKEIIQKLGISKGDLKKIMSEPKAQAQIHPGLKKIKIISGGQTGVDRAALDFALEAGIPCGGFCAKGRLAEDGRIDKKYPLLETPSTDYRKRTEANVVAADATLIIAPMPVNGGIKLTSKMCHKHDKPVEIVNANNFDKYFDIEKKSFLKFIESHDIEVLNIAGPRESKGSIYEKAKKILRGLFLDKELKWNSENS